MPWKDTSPMDERRALIRAWEAGVYSISELSGQYGVSRVTAYKWIQRFLEEGLEGLQDRSRRPISSPRRTSKEVEDAIVAIRKRKQNWGPKKIIARLSKRYPDRPWPAVSTGGEILKRHGLVQPRKRRRQWDHPKPPPITVTRANELHTIDFKGEFRLGDTTICYPLTIQDRWSRFIVGCRALPGPFFNDTKAAMEQIFRDYGLPERIRSDNGTPFASTGIAGLSKLNVWWMSLGIVHERTDKGRPDQNGAHERMHRELKAETTRPPADDMKGQDRSFRVFTDEYNYERPHEGIGQRLPSELWTPSPRPFPSSQPKPEYPGHFEIRKVYDKGRFKFNKQRIFLSEALDGWTIGLEPVDDGIWSIVFFNTLLGRYDERSGKIY